MEYVDNHDGTFSVRAWEIDFGGARQGCYIYSQTQLVDWMGDLATPAFTATMVWLKRNHRPAVGIEINTNPMGV